MEDTITKKELLEITGISYGSLYRWRRMGLIPGEWFGRISTFTGQETVFPREKILQRVAQIQQMKDTLSLEEMAAAFAPVPCSDAYTPAQLVQAGVLDDAALQLYGAARPLPAQLSSRQAVVLWAFGTLLTQVGREAAFALCDLLAAWEDPAAVQLVVLRKLGVDIALCLPRDAQTAWESGVQVMLQMDGEQMCAQCAKYLQLWMREAPRRPAERSNDGKAE